MSKIKIDFKIKKVWKYMVFLFAFICCGFVFNTFKIDASPAIFIPDSGVSRDELGRVDSVVVYIGWDFATVNSAKIDLGGSWSASFGTPNSKNSTADVSIGVYNNSTKPSAEEVCASAGISSCTGSIASYKINGVGSKASIAGNAFNVNVSASNKTLLVVGGNSSESRPITFDTVAPNIISGSVSSDGVNKKMGIGSVLKFNFQLSESSTVAYSSSRTAVKFSVGSSQKTAYCTTRSTYSNSLNCEYKISNGDSGNISTTVQVINGGNVKDQYGNGMSSTVSSISVVNSNNLTVDGVKSSVKSISVEEGTYSFVENGSNKIKVTVTFNENLSAASGPSAKMSAKIGNSESVCAVYGVNGANITFYCSYTAQHQGAFKFISLTDYKNISDEAGNSLSSYTASKDFKKVIVDNRIPGLNDGFDVSVVGCQTNDDDYYCVAGSTVNVTFKFNMELELLSKTVTFKFGNNDGKGDITFEDTLATNNQFNVIYVIASEDSGRMSLSYSFNLIAKSNGKSNTESNLNADGGVVVDNTPPVVDNVDMYMNEEKIAGNVAYGSSTETSVVFKINIKEESQLFLLDQSKIILVDSENNVISIDQNGNYGIVGVSSIIEEDVLIVTVVTKGACNIDFKIKILEEAIEDFFKWNLESDYYSDLYTINNTAPKYDVTLVYPEFKGYNNGSKWILISGDTIEFEIESEDDDLKDYCVVPTADEDCVNYSEITNEVNSYSFEKDGSNQYSFVIRVRDDSLNVTEKEVAFELKEMFTYSNGEKVAAKSHSITVDVSMFDNDELLKYKWFKDTEVITFDEANTTRKQDNSIEIDGFDTFNGNYRVCINGVEDNVILCSEYVMFDTKIDEFNVDVSNSWVNFDLPTTISFNDSSAIKCIAVGKNISTLNCNMVNNDNVVIYRTSQAINPLKKYFINENGAYYFYIEDAVGNNQTIVKNVSNVDKNKIDIQVYNGTTGEFNTNLEINSYKKSHSFLVTLDKDVIDQSAHSLYRYFFSIDKYTNITTKDIFNAYYLKSLHREEITNCNKLLNIVTPNEDGIHNLYIMAVDEAGNVSFKIVNDIMVDASGPVIKMYDSNNVEVSGGSSNYIAVFDYSVVLEDKDSKLDLNNIAYKWVDNEGRIILERVYNECGYDYNTCRIPGENIEFEAGVFKPTEKYRFVITAYDKAGNNSTFITNEFMIDTTPPLVEINVDENAWYENGNVSFTVSKENNGTLNSISYCLNDCLNEDDSYNRDNFKLLTITSNKVVEKTLNLVLKNGVNTLYVYASDVFGNYTYEKVQIKYDAENVEISVNGLNSDGIIDLTNSEDLSFEFVIKDKISGIDNYCVYYYTNPSEKDCFVGNSEKEISKIYNVVKNGIYVIEAFDVVGNKTIYNVSVLGIDTEPVEFDLLTNVKEGNFVSGSVTISASNMRKFMVDNVEEKVGNISYIKLPYDTLITDYEQMFNNNVIEYVYKSAEMEEFVSSFNVIENGLYVVRVVDLSNNISYRYIRINCIDNDSPFIDTNKYPDNKDRIYVDTGSGKNIRIFVKDDGVSKVYKYSNEVIKLFVGSDSLKDLTTGYNSYLGLKVCFEETDCIYNTYNVSTSLSDGYVINNSFVVSAPYNFSGMIRYYLVDGAGNQSSTYSFEVEYQSEVNDIEIEIDDINGDAIEENRRYSKVVVTLSGDEVDDIIVNNSMKYAVVKSNVNMHNQYANLAGRVDTFLSNYGFVNVVNKEFEVTKLNVDDSYYLWLYVVDLLGNEKLIKATTMIRVDTISPSFDEIGLEINKLDSSTYDLTVSNLVAGYSLYIDTNNDGVYENVNLENNVFEFTSSGIETINVKLVDGAGNECVIAKDLNVASKVYARAYQVGNSREVNVVVYNLGSKNVTNFRYIVANVGSGFTYDESTINDDDIPSCSGYEDTCKGTVNGYVEKGVYNINLSSFGKDKMLVLYIYVDGELIDLTSKNVVIDNDAPIIDFDSNNPTIMSTINGNNYNYKVNVVEENLVNLMDKKYILTTNSNLHSFISTYESCVNSSTCARGVYNLNGSLEGIIEVNSNSSKFTNLITGTYYLYVLIEDAFGNSNVARSSEIYIDNEKPIIEYSLNKNPDVYYDINESVYVAGAVKLKLNDNDRINYFEIYEDETLAVVCNIKDSSLDVNCVRNGAGEIGLVIKNDIPYYYLDNGSYLIKVYDAANNVSSINVYVDGSAPEIVVYKNTDGSYEEQLGGKKLYNNLSNLFVSIKDDNFNYLSIDLENTITGEKVTTASRYSYNSDIGKCLNDTTICQYGVALIELVLGNSIQYNKIKINAYDKANKVSVVEINYDDGVPVIWTLDAGESVYIGGMLYVIEESNTINVEIGVNNQLNLDSLLNELILDVDGMNYSQIKGNELFKVTVSKEGNVFDKELTKYIGSYNIRLNYRDDAGNVAVEKEFNVNVLDNTNPTIEIIDNIFNVEVKEEVVINGAMASDNYGLLVEDDVIIKDKQLSLSSACIFELNEETTSCDDKVIKLDVNVYKFMATGIYKFTYTINDLAGKSASIVQTINVVDSIGPEMSSSVEGKTRFEIYFGNRVNGDLSIENLILSYPNSFDKGDDQNKNVEYIGLFGLNNMGEKYKMTDNYLVSNADNSVTYLFKKIGTYYLRFSSTDSKGNVSIFEYEVTVKDAIAPIFSGVESEQVIKLGLEEQFSVENLITKYEIEAIDNYDSNVKIYYELNSTNNHSHEILLKAMDSSNNAVEIVLYVDIEDHVAPIVGELMIEEQTNKRVLEFAVLGGSDNSSNWWHEYSVRGGNWIRIDENTKLEFGDGLSQNVQICIRAIDGSGNVSEEQSCKDILVDTKSPYISGINDGNISSKEVEITISDDRLDVIEVWFNGNLLDLSINDLPFKLSDVGSYQIIARDVLGNESVVNFMINADVRMDVINDINAGEYTINSIDFDRRFLVRVEISYDSNGYSNVYTDLSNINVNANDMLYILGVLPSTDKAFVIFSVNGVNVGNYSNGVNLIGNGNNFKEGFNNEDCFVKFNDYYYAYVLIKENAYNDEPVGVVDSNSKDGSDSKILSGLFIALGAVVVILVGYQIVKFKKRVRAA